MAKFVPAGIVRQTGKGVEIGVESTALCTKDCSFRLLCTDGHITCRVPASVAWQLWHAFLSAGLPGPALPPVPSPQRVPGTLLACNVHLYL